MNFRKARYYFFTIP